MRVKVLVGIASPAWSYGPGEVADIDPAEAARWIKAGIAEPVGGAGETATITPPENAMKPPARPRRRRQEG